MKKLLVLMLVLGMVSVANAVIVYQRFGDATAPYTQNSTLDIGTSPVVIDIYVWGTSDIALVQGDPYSGVDIAQIAVQFNDITKVNLNGGLLSNFTAVSGNPFATTTVSGKAYSGTDTIKGALLNIDGVDAFAMSKLFKLTLGAQAGGVVTFISPGSPLETYIGNTVAGTKYYSSGSVTLVPEPATIALLGIGSLFLLRRRK